MKCIMCTFNLPVSTCGYGCVGVCVHACGFVCVCACVSVFAHTHAHSDCGMCVHSQTNSGSLPATMVRERTGLRGSERMLVYRSAIGILCPPLVTLVIAPFLSHLYMT